MCQPNEAAALERVVRKGQLGASQCQNCKRNIEYMSLIIVKAFVSMCSQLTLKQRILEQVSLIFGCYSNVHLVMHIAI